jgi:hypothetical protein
VSLLGTMDLMARCLPAHRNQTIQIPSRPHSARLNQKPTRMQVVDRERANGPHLVSNLNVEAPLTKLNQGYQPQLPNTAARILPITLETTAHLLHPLCMSHRDYRQRTNSHPFNELKRGVCQLPKPGTAFPQQYLPAARGEGVRCCVTLHD